MAHQAGVVHRDVKPDNILFSEPGVVKLIDFGLVKLMEEDLSLTKSGAVCGTPLYMSPEQARKQKVDARSDLYSLGATYYSLLTGWPPFLGSTVVQILLNHAREPIPDPRELIPEIPENCVRILFRAMAKKREQRYQSAAEMSVDLEAILRGSPQRNESIFLIDKDAPSTPKRPMLEANSSVSSGEQLPANPLVTRADSVRVSAIQLPKPLLQKQGFPRRILLFAAGAAGVGALGLTAARFQRKKSPVTAQALPPIKVGVLHSLSGPMAVSERPLVDALLLAIEELNQDGGLLGRRVQPVVMDGKSELAADSAFTEAAERLLVQEDVAVVFGGYTSEGRRAIVPLFEKYGQLLFYPEQYEGLEASPNIFYTGATPNQLALPALQFCLAALPIKRFFLIGTDGLQARAISVLIEENLQQLGAEVVGTHYEPLGEYRFAPFLKKLEHGKPQIILNLLTGDSVVAFFRELSESGISAAAMPTLSFSLGENELAQLGNLSLAGHFVARARFESVPGAGPAVFARRFKNRYGDHRPISEDMEASYYGVGLWAAAVVHAGGTDVNKVRLALKAAAYELSGVRLRVDPENQHTFKLFEIGKINSDNRIEIIKTGDAPIAPVPFPKSRTPSEWQHFTDSICQKWGENWGGPQKSHPKKGK
jgi:urea transport system substrate-binding protein